MSHESAVKEPTTLTLGLYIASGVSYQFVVDTTDPAGSTNELNRVLAMAKAPLLEEIAALKKQLSERTLTVDECERLAHLVRINSTEIRFDGKPTGDDRLAEKLGLMARQG
jgi:hypothetical protein